MDTLKKEFFKTKNPLTWVKYKEAHNLANKSVNSVKSEYYHSKTESNLNNPEESWNIINYYVESFLISLLLNL